MQMKNKIIGKIFWIIGIGLLVLTWLALDDITTGNEPDYTLEYIIVTITLVYYLILSLYQLLKK